MEKVIKKEEKREKKIKGVKKERYNEEYQKNKRGDGGKNTQIQRRDEEDYDGRKCENKNKGGKSE